MNNDTIKLEVSHEFSCSKETLFDAWTQPDALKQWWKPLGNQLVNVTNDVKVGGEVRYEFQDQSLVIEGRYEKVEGQELLEYTWNWKLKAEPVHDANYKLSVRFEGDADHSRLSVAQYGFANKESIDPHQEGWNKALEQLNDYLGQQGGSAEVAGSKTGKPEIAGYNETPEQVKVGGG